MTSVHNLSISRTFNILQRLRECIDTVGLDGKSQREVRLCMEVWKILWYASLRLPTTLFIFDVHE